MRKWLFGILVAVMVCLPFRIEAQVLYGSLVGTIEDQTGAVVPRAPVSILNSETGFRREGVSGERGDYLFPDIPAGRFEIRVAAAGFRPYVRTGILVSINATVRVNVRLEVGPAAETITVEANAAQLQTDRSDVSVDIGRRVLQDLPVPGARQLPVVAQDGARFYASGPGELPGRKPGRRAGHGGQRHQHGRQQYPRGLCE